VAVPVTLYFGTRPTMLSAMLLLFAALIWGATTHSFNSLEAARIIGSFATSCGEALPAIVVKDIFFLHERGWWMGVYMVFFQSLPSLFVVVSGFVITALGWRWHLWVTVCTHSTNQ
jgi:MFS family permease